MTRSFIISTIANRDIEAIADYLSENQGFETSGRFIRPPAKVELRKSNKVVQ